MASRRLWRRGATSASAGAREAFLILCVQVAALHIGQSLVVPILPLYAQTFGVSVGLVGLLLTMQSLPRMFANVPAGRWADRIGAHRLLAVACATVAISALGAALAPTYGVLLASRILQGIGTAISATAGLTFTANISSKETRARHISRYQLSFLLGNGIGPIIGGVTAQYLGFRAPFVAYAVIATLTGIWIVVRLPDPRIWSPRSNEADVADGSPGKPERRVGLVEILFSAGVLFACFIGFISAFTRSATRNFALVLVGEDMGATEGQIGLTLSIIFAANVAVLYFAGWLGDRYKAPSLVVLAWSIAGVALVAISAASEFEWLLVGAAVYGLAAGIEAPIPAVHITRTIPESAQGAALGVYRTFNDLGLVMGPVLMGWVARVADPAQGVRLNGLLYLGVVVAIVLIGIARRVARRIRPVEGTEV